MVNTFDEKFNFPSSNYFPISFNGCNFIVIIVVSHYTSVSFYRHHSMRYGNMDGKVLECFP